MSHTITTEDNRRLKITDEILEDNRLSEYMLENLIPAIDQSNEQIVMVKVASITKVEIDPDYL